MRQNFLHVILFDLFFSGALLATGSLIYDAGQSVATRITVPANYKRVPVKADSFQEYLRNLSLQPHGSRVRYFDGKIKPADVYIAVVDMPVGKKDLLQCADAVMKLRAEYLYAHHNFRNITFQLTNRMAVPFSRFMDGYRISVKGNRTDWVKAGVRGSSRIVFDEYLEFIYTYAGTHSLARELQPVKNNSLQIGDVFIQGGSPGHAVIVVDVAEHVATKEKIFVLAQSYMPAQEIQILKSGEEMSPWYRFKANQSLVTPEWYFGSGAQKRFTGD